MRGSRDVMVGLGFGGLGFIGFKGLFKFKTQHRLKEASTCHEHRIMVEFQIQCGFKFEFMPFLCGVPVLGRGV